MTTPNGKHEFEAGIEAIKYDLAHYETFDKDPNFERCLEKIKQCRAAIAALKDYEKVKADYSKAVEALILQQGDMEKFRPLIEAARGVDKAAALQVQPHPSQQSDTLLMSIAFHRVPDVLDQIRALIAAIPEDKP